MGIVQFLLDEAFQAGTIIHRSWSYNGRQCGCDTREENLHGHCSALPRQSSSSLHLYWGHGFEMACSLAVVLEKRLCAIIVQVCRGRTICIVRVFMWKIVWKMQAAQQ